MKTPFLTTTFSEDAEQAKSRFANILDTKAKKAGVFALVLVLLLALVCGIAVTCMNNDDSAIVPGDTVVLTRAVEITDGVMAEKGDLVYVIYEEAETYHVQMPYMSHPATYLNVPKTHVSKDAAKLANANYAALKPGAVYYQDKDGTPVYYQNKDGTTGGVHQSASYYSQVAVTKREGDWCEVSFIGGEDSRWVKTADLEPLVLASNVDLDYLELQKQVDEGHVPWRLSAHEVVNDYLMNVKKLPAKMRIDGDRLVESGAHSMSFVTEEYHITVYQPIKKGEGGIWVIGEANLMQDQMEAVLPEGVEVMVNSGMGWRINLERDEIIYSTDSKTVWTVEKLSAQMGFDAKEYYGKDIDVLIYEYTAPQGKTAYMFLFDGKEMFAHFELDTQEKLETAKQTFIKWTEGKI